MDVAFAKLNGRKGFEQVLARRNLKSKDVADLVQIETLDEVMHSMVDGAAEIDTLLATMAEYTEDYAELCYNPIVDGKETTMKAFIKYGKAISADVKLCVCLLNAWDTLLDTTLTDKKERKMVIKQTKNDLVKGCDTAKPFPADVLLVLDKFADLGDLDASLKAASND